MIKRLCFIFLLVINFSLDASALELRSSTQQTTLLELYTSEGCSSCPPADRWLSHFKNDTRLWQQIVPVAFHVDYWNRLGWRDRFSNAAYTARQQNYQRHNYVNVVYTPGFVRNGREWRGWFEQQPLPLNNTKDVGVLTANIDKGDIQAEFMPNQPVKSLLLLNIALLGFDQTTDISRGENRGKKLNHDFVVIGFRQFEQNTDSQGHQWQLSGISEYMPAETRGIAIWVTTENDPTPIQATGGFLDVKKL